MPKTFNQTVIWTSGKHAPPANLHGQRMICWIYRPGLTGLSSRIGRYMPGKGWVIDNTDNATVFWWTHLEPPPEKP